MGTTAIVTMALAGRRSESLCRYVWQVTGFAYFLWAVAQTLAIYREIVNNPLTSQGVSSILFALWFAPMGLALFLQPGSEPRRFDWVVALDFFQAVIFWLAAYLYFFRVPSHPEPGAELAVSVWAPYFVYYGVLLLALFLRSYLANSAATAAVFRRLGLILLASCGADAFYYFGPGLLLPVGTWFDLLWSLGLFFPLLMAATWDPTKYPYPEMQVERSRRRLVRELFPLLFPLLILVMSVKIAQQKVTFAWSVVLLSFAASSARLLFTQHRLLKAQEALQREASHDGLTGLLNHTAILEVLGREVRRSERSGSSLGVIMADLDRFKLINDTHGHVAGDQVLRMVANEFAAALRPYDSLGRYGGEEFLIVVPDCGLQETRDLAERIRQRVENISIAQKNGPLTLTVSLGVAAGVQGPDPDSLLHAADLALYAAKNAGRNRVEPTAAAAAGAGTDSGLWSASS